jgi:hypothetical protein
MKLDSIQIQKILNESLTIPLWVAKARELNKEYRALVFGEDFGDLPERRAWHGDRVMEYLAERESSKDAKPFLIYFGF